MEYSEAVFDALYALEYQLIPTCLNEEQFDNVSTVEYLKDLCSWNDLFADDSWTKIDFQQIQIIQFSSFPLTYIVIKFPEPQDSSLAYLGMLIKFMGTYRYFTLEKGYGMNYICEVTTDSHKRSADYDGDIEMMSFSKSVLERFYPQPVVCSDEAEAIYEKGWAAHQDEDWADAARYYKQAAECGHTTAMEALGEFYIAGFGVKTDHQKGLMWLKRAAEQGSAQACFALGDYYLNGYGAERDPLLAKEWWEKAIERGSSAAAMFYEKYFE